MEFGLIVFRNIPDEPFSLFGVYFIVILCASSAAARISGLFQLLFSSFRTI